MGISRAVCPKKKVHPCTEITNPETQKPNTSPNNHSLSLQELGVLPDLRVLIEGESVLNDGTAIVVYELCKAVLLRPG